MANSYIAEKDLGGPEFKEELKIQLCLDCGLSQLTKVVPPDVMFRHYLYVSSTTTTIRDHFRELAETAARLAGAKPGDLAVDIASNDGTLLRAFQAAGLKPLGVDPAKNLAAEANAAGLETLCAYWSPETAARIVKEHGRASVVTACNVFAHVDDLEAFMKGVAAVLAPEGLFFIELPWVLDFISKGEFDTAYHEHLSYVGLTPLAELMPRSGFELVDVEYFAGIHGGTIRVACSRAGTRRPHARVSEFFGRERDFRIKDPKVYEAFARRVEDNGRALRELVRGLRDAGKTLWAYGASAKGNTLVSFFGLTSADLPVAIDDNPKKWGYYTPGARMKIEGIEALKKAKVDYLLLLAWNFEKEIRDRCLKAGFAGDFIVPVPEAKIVAGAATARTRHG